MRRATLVLVALGWASLATRTARAIPAFARRHELSCHTCHEFQYPRLNSFGDTFRRNGFQMPQGAEDPARARRMVEPGTIAEGLTVFREVPLSVRLAATADVSVDPGQSAYRNRLVGYLVGGGPVAPDVSAFFSLSPFPDLVLHQARVGLHNIAACVIGEGTLNVRAGLLMLLDYQRPIHRNLAPGPSPAGSVIVGMNPFVLDDATLGVEVNGKPGWGPFGYQLAVVAGPPGLAADGDDWKDLFVRASYTLFQDSSHELTIAALGYLGREVAVLDIGGVVVHRTDDVWLAGGDLELDIGPIDVTALAYHSRHSDATIDARPIAFDAARVQIIWGISRRFVASARLEVVRSTDDLALRDTVVAAHTTWLIATNVLATITWRHDLERTERATGVAVLEAAF